MNYKECVGVKKESGVGKAIRQYFSAPLKLRDPEVYEIINREIHRQKNTIGMIPSENIMSRAVMSTGVGVMNQKYSEGYPHARYYQGCGNMDDIESLAIQRAKEVYRAEHANVQSYSGSPANLAIYMALMNLGDKAMGMALDMGGHLTHGDKVSMTSKLFDFQHYGVNKETQFLDMDEILKQALEIKPKVIVAGATAYPRTIDFSEFRRIADKAGAYLVVDMSHIAGLVAAGVHPNPVDFGADAVMTTTHKTLGSARGAMILCKEDYAKKVDKAVFPGMQGGPHMDNITALAVALKEASCDEYKIYGEQIVRNSKALAETLLRNDIDLVTGGTDNHLLLIDLTRYGERLGYPVAIAAEKAGIISNANKIPYDPGKANKPSGLRIGTPSMTRMGMEEQEMEIVGETLADIIKNPEDEDVIERSRARISELISRFPIDWI